MTALRGLFLCVVVALLALTGEARAALLYIDPSTGKLTGANLINLGDLSGDKDGMYAVEFRGGTCISRFSDCDNAEEDFAFNNAADAVIAAQALLDQVLLDGPAGNFDTDFGLTRACRVSGPPPYCEIFVPWGLVLNSAQTLTNVAVALARNTRDVTATVEVGEEDTRLHGRNTNIGSFGSAWAIFTHVPEPGTLLLFGFGAGGALFAGRRRFRRRPSDGR